MPLNPPTPASVIEALEPFATVGQLIDSPFGPALFADDDQAFKSGCAWTENGEKRMLTWGDFRRARAAILAYQAQEGADECALSLPPSPPNDEGLRELIRNLICSIEFWHREAFVRMPDSRSWLADHAEKDNELLSEARAALDRHP